MNHEEPTEKTNQHDLEGQGVKFINQYPAELIRAMEKTTFTTLAVASMRGFTDLQIVAVRKIAEDLYAISFTYYVLNKVEKPDGWITVKTFTEGRGLYIHQFAPALYLDAYAISNFIQDLINPPPHD